MKYHAFRKGQWILLPRGSGAGVRATAAIIRKPWLLACLLLTGWLLAGCARFIGNPLVTPTALPTIPTHTPEPTLTATATPLPTATATVTPEPVYFLWTAPYLPQMFTNAMLLPQNVSRTDRLSTSNYRLEVGADNPASHWVFALVAPFPTITDGISLEELQDFWIGLNREPFNGRPLLMDENTLQMFSLFWEKPARGVVQTVPSAELLDYAWDNQPSWAIIPFESLEPRWKVLEVDGVTPLDQGFQPEGYPLTIPIALRSAPGMLTAPQDLALGIPRSNFDPDLLTSVALTGVTALVRGTAIDMNARGVLYPAEETAPLLRSADILHISNEIPFYSDCPPPVLYASEIKFCSPPSYFELLKYIGTDVIELTGDHFGDYGEEAMLETLEIYKQNNLPYYGGGANSIEASQAVTFEHHGNRIAFIGCNAKGLSFYASASENHPGAVACDLDKMADEIARLTGEGYQVITTFQHVEYYTYDPDPQLKADMQRMAEAGAVIVSGSQAHQPHGMTFLNDSFIHYGLGNLFFDQFRYFPGPELNRAFIDWHTFYNGRYINTRLITITWVDLSKNILTSPEVRAEFLQTIFAASHWEPGNP